MDKGQILLKHFGPVKMLAQVIEYGQPQRGETFVAVGVAHGGKE
jgi:hypothetical protein